LPFNLDQGGKMDKIANSRNAEGAPTSAIAVANAFLDIQAEDTTNFPPIDAMKLQKLVFYAHAWWLANRGEPLFPEDVEAWPWGPVVREVWEEFREFGRRPIEGKRGMVIAPIRQNGQEKWGVREPSPPEEDIMVFLKKVWNEHKEWTGIQLSNATHEKGEPWQIVYESKQRNLVDKPRIPNELIREIFRNKLES